jgi:hypothetical protein
MLAVLAVGLLSCSGLEIPPLVACIASESLHG